MQRTQVQDYIDWLEMEIATWDALAKDRRESADSRMCGRARRNALQLALWKFQKVTNPDLAEVKELDR